MTWNQVTQALLISSSLLVVSSPSWAPPPEYDLSAGSRGFLSSRELYISDEEKHVYQDPALSIRSGSSHAPKHRDWADSSEEGGAGILQALAQHGAREKKRRRTFLDSTSAERRGQTENTHPHLPQEKLEWDSSTVSSSASSLVLRGRVGILLGEIPEFLLKMPLKTHKKLIAIWKTGDLPVPKDVIIHMCGNVADAEAEQELLQLSKEGEIEATRQLAKIYKEGRGEIAKDISKSIGMYAQVADAEAERELLEFSAAGEIEATTQLAKIYEEGCPQINKSISRAVHLYAGLRDRLRKLVNTGNTDAKRRLAELYEENHPWIGQNTLEAIRLYVQLADKKAEEKLRILANKEIVEAQRELARIYAKGCPGIPQNIPEAIGLYARVADGEAEQELLKFSATGEIEAKRQLARIYEKGCPRIEKNIPEAIRLYAGLAMVNDATISGEAVEKLDEFSNRDIFEATRQLAKIYEKGRPRIEQNIPEAIRLYAKLTKSRESNFTKAESKLLQWSNSDEIEATRQLAEIYKEGRPTINKDPSKAAGLYIKLANRGSRDAKKQLIRIYEEDHPGMPRNTPEVIRLCAELARAGEQEEKEKLRIFAIQGEIEAQHHFAQLSKEEGNYAQARYWFRILAQRGSIEAQRELEALGVRSPLYGEKDLVKHTEKGEQHLGTP